MPLSEHEQRILQEMEQTLREHDRAFVERVDHHSHRLEGAKGARAAIVFFLAGLVLMLTTFRFSVALASAGFLVMVVSALIVGQHIRQAGTSTEKAPPRWHSRPIRGDWSEVRRRMRARFGHRA